MFNLNIYGLYLKLMFTFRCPFILSVLYCVCLSFCLSFVIQLNSLTASHFDQKHNWARHHYKKYFILFSYFLYYIVLYVCWQIIVFSLLYWLTDCLLQCVRRCPTACSRCSAWRCRRRSGRSSRSPVRSTCLTSRRARRRRPGPTTATPVPPSLSTYDRPTTRPSSRSSAATAGRRSTTSTTTTTVRWVRNVLVSAVNRQGFIGTGPSRPKRRPRIQLKS